MAEPGAERVDLPGGRPVDCGCAAAPRPREQTAEILVTIRSQPSSRGLGWVNRQLGGPAAARVGLSPADFAEHHGASPRDLDAVVTFARRWGLDAEPVPRGQRAVRMAGTAEALEAAFGVGLEVHRDGSGRLHAGRSGRIRVPADVGSIMRAVLGLDECLRVEPLMSVRPLTSASTLPGDGGGHRPDRHGPARIALLAPGAAIDDGQAAATWAAAGLEDPPPRICPAGPAAGTAAGRRATVAALAMAVAIARTAPDASIDIHSGAGGERGLAETLAAAMHDLGAPPTLIVLGFGAAEAAWSAQGLDWIGHQLLVAAALGIPVVCAASGAARPTFPASASHALSVGPRSARAASGVFAAPLWRSLASTADAGDSSAIGDRLIPDLLTPARPRCDVRVDGRMWRCSGPAIAAAQSAARLAAGEVYPGDAGVATASAPVARPAVHR